MRLVSLLLILAGCVTVRGGDPDALKTVVEAFHQRIRFSDFRGAAQLVVPERREAFIQAREAGTEEKDLHFTNYELENATLSDDGRQARAVSKVWWYRLPSTTESSATVTSVYVWRRGGWQLESISRGPFAELAPAPEARDGGP